MAGLDRKKAKDEGDREDTGLVRVLGVRHHGPGSARSVVRALEAMGPDIILIEGPPDADALMPLAGHAELEPPVALLVYLADSPKHAAFYPFAAFSPEWQAIQFGLRNGHPVRFIDLPQAHQLGEPEPVPDAEGPQAAEEPDAAGEADPELSAGEGVTGTEEDASADEGQSGALARAMRVRLDPLQALAEAAGYDDGERWWEHMVEHRRDADGDVFAAISEAMAALRDGMPMLEDPAGHEERREAYMRQSIRAALKEGYRRIAVVCGAWHAPALEPVRMPPAREDAARLKGLPKAKVQAAWVPWTHGRLCRASGYGAGIASPGWYHHLWTAPDRVVVRWLTRVARLLREGDVDASSAHVIEAVRLAETLAALHGRSLPDLAELNEAVKAIFCFGDTLPMRLIHDKLIVGETLGKVPADAPTVPLQQDLIGLQKQLKLAPKAAAEPKELDLRKPTDLERSRLLYRLGLLGIPWGEITQARGKGTFKEVWQLRWHPEFAVAVIEAAAWGNTVHDAAAARTIDRADKAADLPALTGLLDDAILAELPGSTRHIMVRIQAEAALASDVAHLMRAIPALANVLRYGNVRQSDTAMVAQVVEGMVARVVIGLPGACFSLNDEAAAAMFLDIQAVSAAIGLLQLPEQQAAWHATLASMLDRRGLHGLVAGRCARILLDAGAIDGEEAARRLNLALSRAVDPAQAGAWVEGLLKGSGLLLLHDEALWGVLDAWVEAVSADAFPQVLPLLRRTFSSFSASERRQMGERAARGRGRGRSSGPRPAAIEGSSTSEADPGLDLARADAVLPLAALLLGLGGLTACTTPIEAAGEERRP